MVSTLSREARSGSGKTGGRGEGGGDHCKGDLEQREKPSKSRCVTGPA